MTFDKIEEACRCLNVLQGNIRAIDASLGKQAIAYARYPQKSRIGLKQKIEVVDVCASTRTRLSKKNTQYLVRATLEQTVSSMICTYK